MFTEYFARAESNYRQQRFLREADEFRLARSVSGRTSRWAALFHGARAATSGKAATAASGKAAAATSGPAPCAG